MAASWQRRNGVSKNEKRRIGAAWQRGISVAQLISMAKGGISSRRLAQWHQPWRNGVAAKLAALWQRHERQRQHGMFGIAASNNGGEMASSKLA
jgi:hypothetical protein